MVARLSLLAVVAVLTLLLAEGVVSLVAGRSLWHRRVVVEVPRVVPDLATDEERQRASAAVEGHFRAHLDPRVGNALRPGAHEMNGAPYVADAAGVRARPDGPVPPDAQIVAVLGDSVAFGQGLHDEDTLAVRLERVLAEVRGPAARPVVCRTIAVSGWNHRNAVAFLTDHWDLYAPDVVVYLPVPNDLGDTFGVTEAGHRRQAPDPASSEPWIPISVDAGYALQVVLQERYLAAGLDLRGIRAGPDVLASDLTAESSRRYDDNAASIERLARLMERTGGHLLVGFYVEESFLLPYTWVLRERLLARGLAVPEVPLLAAPHDGLHLPDDPHPNGVATEAFAVWIARALLERGWVDRGADRPLPEAPAVAQAARAELAARDVVRERARAARAEAADALQAVVDPSDGTGMRQIYGGLNPDATIGARLLAVVRAGGDEIVVRLAGVEGAEPIHPLEVGVEVDGRRIGRLVVPAASGTGDAPIVQVRLPVPGPASDPAPDAARGPTRGPTRGPAHEVRLVPADWTVLPFQRRSQLVSCRLVRLACE